MEQTITLDQVLTLAGQLSARDKVRLIEKIAPQIERVLDTAPKRKSLRGIWRGVGISASEIDAARKEMWRNFPRDDF